MTATNDERIAFGPFRLFAGARRLESDDGTGVAIGGRALDLLIALVKQAGNVVSKAELVAAVWPDTVVVESALRVHVAGLRKALRDGAGGTRYITNVAGRGYSFVAPVRRGTLPETSDRRALANTLTNSWSLAHGLPPRLTRLAGRDATVHALREQLTKHRFVTILGAAGIGKTTVAVSVAYDLLADFEGGVRFIDLASVSDPDLVATTVASTLGLVVQTEDVLPPLQAFLHDKRALLILDGCEHVVERAAALGEYLFQHAPHVHLLATSREALRVEGERLHRLAPLETPASHAGLTADALQAFPAVQVFLERAVASGWTGVLTGEDVPRVAAICKRLDGVALALEIAAGFVGECGLAGTAGLLDDRFRLLRQQGRRTAPPRQQTLSALLAWSYDRLPEGERILLRRLAVFNGSFTIEAGRAVIGDAHSDPQDFLLGALTALVNKSLVSTIVEDGRVTYRLLETTRDYAFERLEESGERERVALRHAKFVTERLGRDERAEGGRSFVDDLGNVRTALEWSFSSGAGHAIGVRLAAAVAPRLLDVALLTECHHWSREALAVLPPVDVGTSVEFALQETLAISAMFTRGNGDEVRRAIERGIEIARALDDRDSELRLLQALKTFLIRVGDFVGALEAAERALALAKGSPHPSDVVDAQLMVGVSQHLCGNQTVAEHHLEEGLRAPASAKDRRARLFGYEIRVRALLAFCRTLWLRGFPDRAVSIARRAIVEAKQLNRPVAICISFIYTESVFAWRGDWNDALRVTDELAEHARRHALSPYLAVAASLKGELLVKTGSPREGCQLLKEAASTLAAERHAVLFTTFSGALAEGLAATGEIVEALATVDDTIAEATRRGGTFDLPDLLRLKASFLTTSSEYDERVVGALLSSAIELARSQGALAWELRALTMLTREQSRRGRPGSCLNELAAAYSKFDEGTETADLRAARHALGIQATGPRN